MNRLASQEMNDRGEDGREEGPKPQPSSLQNRKRKRGSDECDGIINDISVSETEQSVSNSSGEIPLIPPKKGEKKEEEGLEDKCEENVCESEKLMRGNEGSVDEKWLREGEEREGEEPVDEEDSEGEKGREEEEEEHDSVEENGEEGRQEESESDCESDSAEESGWEEKMIRLRVLNRTLKAKGT